MEVVPKVILPRTQSVRYCCLDRTCKTLPAVMENRAPSRSSMATVIFSMILKQMLDDMAAKPTEGSQGLTAARGTWRSVVLCGEDDS
jgi:hypothetical protein